MSDTRFHGRRAATIENDTLRVTVLVEGGHIAEILHKKSGVNPLWIPRWPSLEPSSFRPDHHVVYGTASDGRLLAGIMGHNLCLDIFGGPSDEECAAGVTAHGEGSVVPYRLEAAATTLTAHAHFPLAGIEFTRRLSLDDTTVYIREHVTNLLSVDRPIGWTQHVTLGQPFLEVGRTEIRTSATRSLVFEHQFGSDDYLVRGVTFDWPLAPTTDGGVSDRTRFTGARSSSAYTAHLMDARHDSAWFLAHSPSTRLVFGYAWRRADFPWLGIWEENRSRMASPWNGREVTCGMEFGVSPIPESRRAMVERGPLFETPTFRWLPARTTLTVDYRAFVVDADVVPHAPPGHSRD